MQKRLELKTVIFGSSSPKRLKNYFFLIIEGNMNGTCFSSKIFFSLQHLQSFFSSI